MKIYWRKVAKALPFWMHWQVSAMTWTLAANRHRNFADWWKNGLLLAREMIRSNMKAIRKWPPSHGGWRNQRENLHLGSHWATWWDGPLWRGKGRATTGRVAGNESRPRVRNRPSWTSRRRSGHRRRTTPLDGVNFVRIPTVWRGRWSRPRGGGNSAVQCPVDHWRPDRIRKFYPLSEQRPEYRSDIWWAISRENNFQTNIF